MSSPVFVGREDELDQLEDAGARAWAGDPTVVLVGGDAGIGKTRLVSEFVGRLADTRVLVGGCLALTDASPPYAPIVEVLRQLSHELSDDGIRTLLTGPRDLLRRLLPDAARAAAGGEAGRSATTQLHEAVLSLLETLAAQSRVVLVLEDLHWASASTLDLVAFLARTSLRGPLLVIATFRTDELHRRHPLRPVLAELGRLADVRRLDVRPLSADEQRKQLAAILGGPPSESVVRAVVERSEGNAFYAEELLALEDTARGGLPPTLRDILTQRLASVPEEAMAVLRVAAAAGRRMDHQLLERVGELEPAALHHALRQAVAHGTLLPDGRHYTFRHALLQEAVHDDLLPGERVKLHRRLAEALLDDPELAADGAAGADAEIAHHAHEAMLVDEALAASVRASERATRLYAFADALGHLERALTLWEGCSEDARTAGPGQRELLRRAAAVASNDGQHERAIGFLDAALADPAVHGDEERAELLAELGFERGFHGQPRQAMTVLEEAVSVADGPSPARAQALSRYALALAVYGSEAEAIAPAREAIALARDHDAPLAEVLATNALGVALFATGRGEEGEEQLRTSIATARAHDFVEWALVGYTNLSSVLRRLQGAHDRALAVARDGLEYAADAGWAEPNYVRVILIDLLVDVGDIDEADRRFTDLRIGLEGGQLLGAYLVVGTRLHLAQGRVAQAAALFERARDGWARTREPQYVAPLAEARARIALAQGRPDDAWEILDEVRGAPVVIDSHDPIRPLAARVVADQIAEHAGGPEALEVGRERLAGLLAELDELLAAEPEDGWWAPQLRTAVAQVRAERSRALGPPDPAAWAEAEEGVALQERVPEVAYLRIRRAEALLACDRRDEAAALLASVHAECRERGLVALADEAAALARRARVSLEGVTDRDGSDPFGLTPREREVLELVSEGLTNRAIGERLFITGKTASVHVSNILSKLAASNRGEAAAIARHHGLDGMS